ncbi:MAG TPA: sulfide/dihydroorotate dehydrogenase-like FAD/NAD-binding protein [Candidatus Omnitrophota bacterium]|nr:sulfide/dihydroorotate dehydrogenase-like FAD/NAD-binding protein [Candidatus Omnitrophota bacterium]HQO58581.1 sulfide/dihydroorotate dehydrogenase-like FAD/NAD-binding protein [Candidatus Omnitrophota bacterium]HQP11356.1 sulfide/dihydroorotate dehydrogenase-like FAD/NAD-binding protein [Candidatus Omnitrophota bacterium]
MDKKYHGDDVMRIVDKEFLTEEGTRVVKLTILVPDIAAKARAGQFVVLMVKEEGERIPLTIVKADPGKGTVMLIAQEAGFTTKLLAQMNAGDLLYSVVGPLGHATEIKKYGQVILVGGGVGIAEIYPVAQALREAGNHVTAIIGSRTKGLLILERELKEASDECVVLTDDGSYGRKGFVTEALKERLERSKYDLVYAVGPIPMMRAVSLVTKPFGVLTLVSLNAIMVDGTGMCGGCRVTAAGKVKFSCVDGPEFDASQIDWQELLTRNSVYSEQEKHICRLHNAG